MLHAYSAGTGDMPTEFEVVFHDFEILQRRHLLLRLTRSTTTRRFIRPMRDLAETTRWGKFTFQLPREIDFSANFVGEFENNI